MKTKIQALLGVILLSGLVYLIVLFVKKVWVLFSSLNPTISAGIITGATTILAATLAIALGRYYEKKKDIEAHYRSTKTDIYDEFLKEFFSLFFQTEEKKDMNEFVAFLREWQRKMIIWGGEEVLAHYIKWMTKLKSGNPDAESMFMTEELFRLIRKDLGNSSSKLPKGFVAHIMLQQPELFLNMAKINPKITLAEVAEMEALLTKQGESA